MRGGVGCWPSLAGSRGSRPTVGEDAGARVGQSDPLVLLGLDSEAVARAQTSNGTEEELERRVTKNRRPWPSRASRSSSARSRCSRASRSVRAKGDVIAILGASGSGKSTFLRCINLLETPNAGPDRGRGRGDPPEARQAWRSLQPEDPRQLARIRSKLAMVFQGFNLWSHMTILENVIEAPVHVLKVPRKEAIERAEQLLQQGGHLPAPQRLSGAHLGRPAAARSDRARAGDGADRHAVRRADLGARPRTGRRGARRSCAISPTRAAPCSSSPTRWASPATSPARSFFCTKAGSRRRARRSRCSPAPPTERFKQFLSSFTQQERGAAA